MPEQPGQRTTSDSAFAPYDPTSADRRAAPRLAPAAARFVGIPWRLWRSIGGALMCVAALLGFRIWGPMQEIALVNREAIQRDSIAAAASSARDTALSLRVTRLEDGQTAQSNDLRSLKDDIGVLMYLQCETMRRSERGAPSTCISYLRNRGAK